MILLQMCQKTGKVMSIGGDANQTTPSEGMLVFIMSQDIGMSAS